MKIILAISSLGNGGAEKLVVELANELSLNSDIDLISFKPIDDDMLPPRYLSNKVHLKSLNKKKGFDFRVIWKLFCLLKKNKPDVVHLHLNMPLLYFLPIIPFFTSIKFVFTIHSAFETHAFFFKKLNKIYFYKRVKNICLTNSIYDKFSQSFPKLDFNVIENGIKQKIDSTDDLIVKELLSTKDQYNKLILFVGRLSYAKNIPLLLDVFGDELFNDIKLLIIGDGDTILKKKITQLSNKTKNRIQYLGKKSNVLQYMNIADALILTSRNEGLPVVILEALSAGLPIISTPVGGIPDVMVNMRNGILSEGVQNNDIIKAVNKFKSLEKHQIEKIKQNNIKDFNQRFSIQTCALNHLNLYNQP